MNHKLIWLSQEKNKIFTRNIGIKTGNLIRTFSGILSHKLNLLNSFQGSASLTKLYNHIKKTINIKERRKGNVGHENRTYETIMTYKGRSDSQGTPVSDTERPNSRKGVESQIIHELFLYNLLIEPTC